jgi:selenocysteine lyase/cysteine desulfurase/short-subunit dehydrogenase
MDKDILEFRNHFPYLKDHCFLNFAATCPVPQSSIAAMTQETVAMGAPLGKHFYQTLNLIEMARKDLADFIGAHPSEIAFTQNTSSAVSTIALALNLKSGDRILVPDNEFPSNFYPWKNLEENGIECIPFKIEKNISIVSTLKKLSLERVKVISVSAVSFDTGKKIDLKEFADFCREKNIYSCIDAIQAIGNNKIDCHKMGFDFLASGSQKWLQGPVGCGYIFARREHLQKLFVPMVGWTSHKFPEYFDLSKLDFSDEMTRFEPGLPNYIPIVGMGESLRLLARFGIEKIETLVEANVQYLKKGVESLGLELLTGEKDLLGGILCIKIPGKVDHRKVHDHFENANVMVTVRNDYIRVSPHFFTLEEEMDRFLKVLADLVGKPIEKKKIKMQSQRDGVSIDGAILINGATGNLGSLVAKNLLSQNKKVFLLGQSKEKMENLLDLLPINQKSLVTGSFCTDFSQKNWIKDFKQKITDQKFSGLINTSGGLAIDLLKNQSEDSIRDLFEVQFFAPLLLMQEFLRECKVEKPLGILNVLSSSGRCGYPLLSTYASAHGALWTLSESLQREEYQHIPVMNYVAQSQHSPLQKLMGRISLRYYKVGKSFDFALAEEVAQEVVEQFLSGKTLVADRNLQIKLWTNAVAPGFFTRQIAKAWKR